MNDPTEVSKETYVASADIFGVYIRGLSRKKVLASDSLM